MQYLVKWKNYPSADNTWEPIENLCCHELIGDYESKRKLNSGASGSKQSKSGRKSGTTKPLVNLFPTKPFFSHESKLKILFILSTKKIKVETEPAKMKEIECIHDMKRMADGVMYFVEYVGSETFEWVPIDIVKRKYPQKVIAFYEKCVTWDE